MEADRFDTLARSLTAVDTRRRALAMALAGTLALLGLSDAEAKKGKGKGKGKGKKKKKGCPKGQKECYRLQQRSCVPLDHCCNDDFCSFCASKFCNQETGTCGCLPGYIEHKGRCGIFPTCLPPGVEYIAGGPPCCGGDIPGPNMGTDEDPHFIRICDKVCSGPCIVDSECYHGRCRGFTCINPNSCSCLDGGVCDVATENFDTILPETCRPHLL